MTLLARGTVLRKHGAGEHFEAGIVFGPSPHQSGAVEVVHGWVDNPPDAGTFDLPMDTMMCGGRWRLATEEESAIVRALFLEHARRWGPTSKTWVANERPECTSGEATNEQQQPSPTVQLGDLWQDIGAAMYEHVTRRVRVVAFEDRDNKKRPARCVRVVSLSTNRSTLVRVGLFPTRFRLIERDGKPVAASPLLDVIEAEGKKGRGKR